MGAVRFRKIGVVGGFLALALAGALGGALMARASAVPQPVSSVAAHPEEQEGQASGWIGVMIANLNERLAQRLGLTRTSGVVILRVMKEGPAEQAGLKAKDIITQVGATAVSDVKGVRQALAALQPGDTVTITVLREGQETPITVTVTVAQRPQPPQHPRPHGPRRGPALFGLLPFRLEELQGIPLGELFSHIQSLQYALTDKDGKPLTVTIVAGTVTAKTANSLTVQLNGASAGTKSYTVSGATKVLGKGGKYENLAVGDRVLVVTVGAGDAARYIVVVPQPQAGSGAPPPPQGFWRPFQEHGAAPPPPQGFWRPFRPGQFGS